MNLFSFIPLEIYQAVYTYTIFALCMVMVVRNIHSEGNQLIYQPVRIPLPAILLTLVLALYAGMRAHSSVFFGDTSTYVYSYENIVSGYSETREGEWLWQNFMYFCKSMGLNAQQFFIIDDLLYFGLMLICCWRLFPRNTWVAILFCFISFSCFTYGTNGIRNGLACSMIMAAMSLVVEDDWRRYMGLLLLLPAMAIHKSTSLPIAACFAAVFLIKEPKYAIGFWVASIFISLLVGNAVGEFFADLGFDDRMGSYFEGQGSTEEMQKFSSTGFRWDFLLYSAMPVVMTWYVTVKRAFRDRAFNIIAITYILSNAFWVMVIRAAYSNRFAYLSWFLYPIVIAYPLLRFRIWDDQDRKTALILLAYAGFTLIMFLRG